MDKNKIIELYRILADISVKGDDLYKLVACLNLLKEEIEGGGDNGTSTLG